MQQDGPVVPLLNRDVIDCGDNRPAFNNVIANAEENLSHSFEMLRAVLEADNFGEALKIQQEALRDTFERNLKQIREVTEMLTSGGQSAFKPLGKLVANFRDNPRKKAA